MSIHIEAKKEDIAETVLMPGDPLRSKYIADNFLDDYKLVNDVRGMLAFTGYYKGKRVTIMSSGMGIPSMGIYSYELYNNYDVKNIIRIGTCGSYIKEIDLFDLVLATASYSETSYDNEMGKTDEHLMWASSSLNNKIKKTAESLKIKITMGIVHSNEAFYNKIDYKKMYEEFNCIAVEMESFALFYNAHFFNREASCLLTVTDSFVTDKHVSSDDREQKLKEMIELALESI
jgi:purine-nucleoside phosphorylase